MVLYLFRYLRHSASLSTPVSLWLTAWQISRSNLCIKRAQRYPLESMTKAVNRHSTVTRYRRLPPLSREILPGGWRRHRKISDIDAPLPVRGPGKGRTYEQNGKVSQGLFFAEAPIAGRWNTASFSQSRHLIFQRLVCCGGPCVPYLRMTHSLTVRNILQKTFVSHICFAKSFPCFSYERTLLTSAP